MNDVKCTLQNSVKNIKKFQEEIHIYTKEDIDNQLSRLTENMSSAQGDFCDVMKRLTRIEEKMFESVVSFNNDYLVKFNTVLQKCKEPYLKEMFIRTLEELKNNFDSYQSKHSWSDIVTNIENSGLRLLRSLSEKDKDIKKSDKDIKEKNEKIKELESKLRTVRRSLLSYKLFIKQISPRLPNIAISLIGDYLSIY